MWDDKNYEQQLIDKSMKSRLSITNNLLGDEQEKKKNDAAAVVCMGIIIDEHRIRYKSCTHCGYV